MKILQLCCFTELWGPDHVVESIDIKKGRNIFEVPDDYGRGFDLVCASPPCDQFTKANVSRWSGYPEKFIKVALKCLKVCKSSSGFWFLENPPGRIERFIPELVKYRVLTWRGNVTNKEYVVYSNFIIMSMPGIRYGKETIMRSKLVREEWQSDFIRNINSSLV